MLLDLANPCERRPGRLGSRRQGGIREAFSVGDYANKPPFRSIARLTADSVASEARHSPWRGRIASSGWPRAFGRLDLDLERGAIEPRTPIVQPGPAAAPIQKAGKLIIMTFQDQQNGGLALWAIDPDSSTVAWNTVVGTPWIAGPVCGQADSLT